MIHRISQGLRALFAWATPIDYHAAAQVLSPRLMVLFRRMRRSEQLHSLRVLRSVRAAGESDLDLHTAALLHDCGKSRYTLTLIGRTLSVLVHKFAPDTWARWSSGDPRTWRRPFAVSAQHPDWSADDMLFSGATPRAAALARRHQSPPPSPPLTEEDHLLLVLQSADEIN